ncbi:MAG: hypothetical protein LC650_01575 [Actinobacteria bacterium]|nr:hypothetical protein [Actinomycetota bacterium]
MEPMTPIEALQELAFLRGRLGLRDIRATPYVEQKEVMPIKEAQAKLSYLDQRVKLLKGYQHGTD